MNIVFLTIVDDYSRMTWLFLLKLESDVNTVVKKFLLLIKISLLFVKVFISDDKTKFLNAHYEDLLKSVGVVLQSSCVHTFQ